MAEEKKQWYVVNTYAGHENKVKENLERRIETMGLQDALFQIVVAEETEIEYKNGKEVEKTYNLLKKEGFERFDITRHDRAYFYSQKEYNQFLRIFTTPFEKYTKDE